jgi:hypothetical protein
LCESDDTALNNPAIRADTPASPCIGSSLPKRKQTFGLSKEEMRETSPASIALKSSWAACSLLIITFHRSPAWPGFEITGVQPSFNVPAIVAGRVCTRLG